jgi:hypothetical protein
MVNTRKSDESSSFEKNMREYLKQGRDKLANDLAGTREAIRLIAGDKTREFIKTMDKGLAREERDYLQALIISSMYQSFCYGYGIGKVEGSTSNRIFL